MPSTFRHTKVVLDYLAGAKPRTIYDLGSGGGTFALAIARRFPLCPVIGIENSPLPYYFSRLIQFLSGKSNLQFQRKDFFEVSLREADAIVCYLFSGAMQKLKSKLEQELQPGTIVISSTFAIPGWKPESAIDSKDLYHSKIYVYRVPVSIS